MNSVCYPKLNNYLSALVTLSSRRPSSAGCRRPSNAMAGLGEPWQKMSIHTCTHLSFIRARHKPHLSNAVGSNSLSEAQPTVESKGKPNSDPIHFHTGTAPPLSCFYGGIAAFYAWKKVCVFIMESVCMYNCSSTTLSTLSPGCTELKYPTIDRIYQPLALHY